MKNKFLLLLKINLQGRLFWNRKKEEGKGKYSKAWSVGMGIAIAIAVFAIAAYCFLLAFGFGQLGLSNVLPGYSIAIASLSIVFFTFIKTNGVLFGTKDYDMLMSMPIKNSTVISVKFVSMYFMNFAIALVVMGSIGVGYYFWHPLDIGTIAMWIVSIFFAPLLPMSVAAIAGAVIAAVGSGFRHKVLVQVLLVLGVLALVFGGSFWVQQMAEQGEGVLEHQLTDLGEMISKLIHNIYPPAAWFDGAIQAKNIGLLLLFLGVSTGVYGVFAFVCGKNYRRINSALTAHRVSSNYKLGTLKTSSILVAIAKKEAKRFFSSVVYITNMGLGYIFAVVLAVACLFVSVNQILAVIGIPTNAGLTQHIVNLAPYVIGALVGMSCTTSVSLSLEGGNLWIMESLPISGKQLLQGKMLFQIIMALPVSLFCAVMLGWKLQVGLPMMVCYLVFAAVAACFSTVYGSFINTLFPKFHWQTEVEVIKQSASSLLGILGGMVIFFAMGFAAFHLCGMIQGEYVLLIFSAIMAVLGCLAYVAAGKRIVKVLA